ncbi:hypothetical protein N9N67_05485, partial [Bacteriovoracaceae bacterium]|nr:hypothetical protein [Bacteriovoracaceae bacterium]
LFSLFIFNEIIFPEQNKVSFIKQIDQAIIEEQTNQRKIASNNFCQENVKSNLRDRIYELEKKIPLKTNISGHWRGVDLTQISSAQQLIISQYNHLIGFKNIHHEYSECINLICVFNDIYKDPDNRAGLIHYLIYLEKGIFISTGYPKFNDQSIAETNNYIFTIEELNLMYNFLETINITSINSIQFDIVQKLPEEEFHELVADKKLSKITSCSFLDQNTLYFNRNCLNQRQLKNELTIRIIDEVEKRFSSEDNFIRSNDYVLTIDYIINNSYDFKYYNTISENYQKNVVSNNSNNKENYTDIFERETNKDYKKHIISLWKDNETDYLSDCWKNEKARENSFLRTKRQPANIDNLQPVFQCLKRKIDYFEKFNITNQVYNCKDLSGNEKDRLKNILENQIIESFTNSKIELSLFGKETLKGRRLLEDFISNFDPYLAVSSCLQEKKSQHCFYDQVKRMFYKENIEKNYNLNNTHLKYLLSKIKLELSYDTFLNNYLERTKFIMSQLLGQVKLNAKRIVRRCMRHPHKNNIKLLEPVSYSGIDHFIKLSALNCINKKLENKEIIENLFKLEIINNKVLLNVSQKEKKFFIKKVKNQMIQQIDLLLNHYKLNESLKLDDHFNGLAKSFIEKIEKDKTFTASISIESEIVNKCLDRLSQDYPKNIIFHTGEMLDHLYGIKICGKIKANRSIASKVSELRLEKVNQFVQKAKRSFLVDYKKLVQNCKNTFIIKPGSPSFNKYAKLRNICIEESFDEQLSITLKKLTKTREGKIIPKVETQVRNIIEEDKHRLIRELKTSTNI